ncbi:DUF4352 domain-containing protein [Streptomyces sp. NPDC051907]|uniref:DUF4352 domain-containing protein n=1 Tax=Streptomyces sp. NPDC051907 TaxID=3155284 RepID=UPI003422DE87
MIGRDDTENGSCLRGTMRQAASVLLLPALLVGGTACQSTHSGPAEEKPSAGVESAGPKGSGRTGKDSAATGHDGPQRAATSGRASTAWLGDSADLRGKRLGEHLQMSVQAYVDPALSVKKKLRPQSGKRWMGVEMAVANVGGKPFDASSGKMWAVDGKGKRYPSIKAGEITTGFPLKLNALPVGEDTHGWVVFEVPENARIVRLDSTVGTDSRSWHLQPSSIQVNG